MRRRTLREGYVGGGKRIKRKRMVRTKKNSLVTKRM